MASDDDTAYKQLFAHPEMVRDLLLGFVPGTWVRQLDVTSFERVSGSYVSDGGQQRHSDMVWKARLSGEWIYLYLLLEFQSRSDPWMALRMQVYVGLLYQDLVKRHELPKPFQLPPVFPVVLYNGERPWSASTSLSDMVAPLPSDLQPLQAAQRYVLVDQRRLSSEALSGLSNCAAIAFRIDRLRGEQEVTDELEKWRLMRPSTPDLTLDMGIVLWAANRLRGVRLRRMINRSDVSTEDKAMHVTYFDLLKEVMRQEAMLDVHRDRLRQMLIKRFGPLSLRLDKRIERAQMEDLDRWFDRLFDAKTVREIFADKQSA